VAILDGAVEERVELVILALADGIKLVIVALRACYRETEERRRGGIHAIHHGLDAELLRVDPTFLVDLRVAIEARRDFLLQRWVWQQVPRKLIDHKLIERQIAIQRIDDPFAVFPNRARG